MGFDPYTITMVRKGGRDENFAGLRWDDSNATMQQESASSILIHMSLLLTRSSGDLETARLALDNCDKRSARDYTTVHFTAPESKIQMLDAATKTLSPSSLTSSLCDQPTARYD